jgi:ketosteroid isomerase-like protein
MDNAGFVSFVRSLDEAWSQARYDDLSKFLAEDVTFVSPDGKSRATGLETAVESYRQFAAHASVERFVTFDHIVTQRGEAAVVEYRWEMTWVASGERHDDVGREVLVISHRNGEWRVVWRTQIPA